MELKSIIIDDEPLASKVLINFAKRANDLIVLATFETIKEGFEYLKSINYEVDIVFLDVRLNKESSIEYLEKTGEDKMINIVFTSAYRALQFQDKNIQYFDWLEKPIPFRSFEEVIEKYRNRENL
jgi:two-component SAPR family response regulator